MKIRLKGLEESKDFGIKLGKFLKSGDFPISIILSLIFRLVYAKRLLFFHV